MVTSSSKSVRRRSCRGLREYGGHLSQGNEAHWEEVVARFGTKTAVQVPPADFMMLYRWDERIVSTSFTGTHHGNLTGADPRVKFECVDLHS